MEEEVADFDMGRKGEGTQGLLPQDLDKLDISKLTPLTPEVISRQATINIGTIGHVAHGKTTVVKAISGVRTVKFKREMVNNITIKLGYANAKIFKVPDHPRPQCYVPAPSNAPHDMIHPETGKAMELIRHVSFVDCPGHDILMATMLNGAAVMDAALLLIAANEPCPQPQTSEHLAAVEIMKLTNIIVLQNKIDLVKEAHALQQYEEIKKFVKGSVAGGAPIIPISAQLKYNIDVLCEYIVKAVPIPSPNFLASPRMIIVRSFDVNMPGESVQNLKGGVAGGTIVEGVITLGQEIEIRPGGKSKRADGSTEYSPFFSKVVSLFAERNPLSYAVPGGLIGVGTKMDPTLTRADRLVGHVIGAPGKLPEVYSELEVTFFLLYRLLGSAKGTKIQGLEKGEIVMVNVGSTNSGAKVIQVKGDVARLLLTTPVCTSAGEKLALSRRVEKHWRLIGWGRIHRGIQAHKKA